MSEKHDYNPQYDPNRMRGNEHEQYIKSTEKQPEAREYVPPMPAAPDTTIRHRGDRMPTGNAGGETVRFQPASAAAPGSTMRFERPAERPQPGANGNEYEMPRGESPYSPYDDGGYAPENTPPYYPEEDNSPVWPKVLIAMLIALIAGLVIAFFVLVPGNGIGEKFNNLTGNGVNAPVVTPEVSTQDTSANVTIVCPKGNNESCTTAQPLEFTVKTSASVAEIRLIYEQTGEVIGTYTNGDNGTWDVRVYLAAEYDGYFRVQIRENLNTELKDTNARIRVIVKDAIETEAPVTAAPVTEVPFVTQAPVFVTMAPTAAPTEEPEDVNASGFVPVANATAIPTEAPAPAETEVPTPAPTEMITPEPTPMPTEVPTPIPTETPEPTEVPDPTATPMPVLDAAAVTGRTDPSLVKLLQAIYKGGKKQSGFTRELPYNAPDPNHYTYANNGIFTFRGDNFRRNAAYSTVEITTGQMEILWKKDLGSLKTSDGTLYGVGWGTQPAIIKWPGDVRAIMNLYDAKKEKQGLKEVIFGALDGKIYFLDLTTGEQTRDCINIGFPLKSSAAVDPYSRPIMGIGQAISKLANKTGSIGYYVYNLVDQKQLLFLNGRQNEQYSANGAFDGTGLFLSQEDGDALIIGGENGLLYTVDLHTTFPAGATKLTINADTVYLKSKANAQKDNRTGIESSAAMYGRYVYMADTYGLLRCVDTTTMNTVWAVDCGDNTDASIALDFDEDGNLGLYTGTTCYERLKKDGKCVIRRLDALTGEEIWKADVSCVYNSSELAGCKASPVIGENAIDDLVIFTVNMTGKGKTSAVMAFEKKSGKIRWTRELTTTAVSSPVAVYNELGNAWIIQADESGVLHLLDGVSGAEISTLNLGGTIQSSPAVYKNVLVIGTCSKGNAAMYGIKLN